MEVSVSLIVKSSHILSNPGRVRIAEILQSGKRMAEREIIEALRMSGNKMSQSTVSLYLKDMVQSNILESCKEEGRYPKYRVAPTKRQILKSYLRSAARLASPLEDVSA